MKQTGFCLQCSVLRIDCLLAHKNGDHLTGLHMARILDVVVWALVAMQARFGMVS